MVAAWLGAIATCVVTIFTIVAVWWARRAALEAGKQVKTSVNAVVEASRQAKAAIESVEWSRKTAEAAYKQVEILERQIALSEPQPVVLVTIQFTTEQFRSPIIELQNVGEELAFDVKLGDMSVERETENGKVITTASFDCIPFMKSDEKRTPEVTIEAPFYPTSTFYGESNSALRAFMDELVSQKAGYKRGEMEWVAHAIMTYRNARGRRYSQPFYLYALPVDVRTGGRSLKFLPEGSLVDRTEGLSSAKEERPPRLVG